MINYYYAIPKAKKMYLLQAIHLLPSWPYILGLAINSKNALQCNYQYELETQNSICQTIPFTFFSWAIHFYSHGRCRAQRLHCYGTFPFWLWMVALEKWITTTEIQSILRKRISRLGLESSSVSLKHIILRNEAYISCIKFLSDYIFLLFQSYAP